MNPSAAEAIVWTDPARHDAFERWLEPLLAQQSLQRETLCAASADASFRRYFRIAGAHGSCIVMDAPPPLEDVRPFVKVAGLIEQAGLHGPHLLAVDEAQGFLLMSDLGRTLYLDALREADAARADALMRDAIRALVQWQSAIDPGLLPPYDAALLQRELALFPEWCVQREFGLRWNAQQQQTWDRTAALLVASALDQPTVAVHRDWMPRNLMVAEPNPGILDFQDAVAGPVSYDVASLLRDAFISWDEEREIDWAVRWWEQARRAGVLAPPRMDGLAAPPEGARHLLPPQAP
jgi:N-acetylmuramate 1-kinase